MEGLPNNENDLKSDTVVVQDWVNLMRENVDCWKDWNIVRENKYCLEDKSSRQGANDTSRDDEGEMHLIKY